MRMPIEGELFGRYRIVRVVGNGGMGVVYEAHDEALAHRTVALKVISGQFADNPEFKARFRREAETLATLDSPHVITIHDFGEIDGAAYLATQFVRGGDLGQLLRAHGPVRARSALELTAQLADGLGEAHHAGIMHRDIKPSNVLLRDPSNPHLHAYLCDFGIARATQDERFTDRGSVVGSWHYLAPERLNGSAGSVASDIYSLGCVLWAMLTGGPPYTGADAEVAQSHAEEPPRQLIGNDPAIDHVNHILATSMAKDPADRYASTAQMRSALLAPLPQAPYVPGPVDTPTRAQDIAPAAPPSVPPAWPYDEEPTRAPGVPSTLPYDEPTRAPWTSPPPTPMSPEMSPASTPSSQAPGQRPGQAPSQAASQAPSYPEPAPPGLSLPDRPQAVGNESERPRVRRPLRWLAAAAALVLIGTGGWWASSNLIGNDDSSSKGSGAQGSGAQGGRGLGADRASSTGGTVAGDVDGDGHGDVVGWVSEDLQQGWSTHYWYSNGERFTPVYGGENNNEYPNYGDLNGDDKPDTVSVIEDDPTAGKATYRLEVGLDPTKEATKSTLDGIPVEAENSGHDSVLGDFNGDRKLDVMVYVAGTNASTNFWFVAGNGDGTFDPPRQWLSMVDAQIFHVWVNAADFDADGDSDLAVVRNSDPVNVRSDGVTYEGGYNLLILDSTGKELTAGTPISLPTGVYAPRMHVAEVTKDRDPVVLVYNDSVSTDQKIDAYAVDADQQLSDSKAWSVPLDIHVEVSEEFAVGDYNGDGLGDIAYSFLPTDGGRTPIQVQLSNGKGFDDPTTWGQTPNCKTQTCYVSLGVGQ